MVFEKKSTVNYGRVLLAIYSRRSVFNDAIKMEVEMPPVAAFSGSRFCFFHYLRCGIVGNDRNGLGRRRHPEIHLNRRDFTLISHCMLIFVSSF